MAQQPWSSKWRLVSAKTVTQQNTAKDGVFYCVIRRITVRIGPSE